MAKKTTEAAEPITAETVETKQAEGAGGTALTADAAVGQRAAAAEPAPKAAEENRSGFYCYIGPNLKGLIQTGTVYRGTRAEALAKAARAIAEQPLVKTLIVSGDALPSARIRVRTPGNALYENYKNLAGKEGN